MLIDSVHRFKGRASPCVVFTEIDFDTLDDSGRPADIRRRDAGDDEAHTRGIGDVGEGVVGSAIEETHIMAITGKWIFTASMDVDPDKEALFNEVYDTEHIPHLKRSRA